MLMAIPIKYLRITDQELWKTVDFAWSKYHRKLELLPSSLSGMNHPPEDREVGGMIAHISKMCWFIKHYQQQFQLPDDIIDEMMVAAFFHDLGELECITFTKRTIITDRKHIKRETILERDDKKAYHHPIYSAGMFEECVKYYKVPQERKDRICSMIKKHMSHWYEDGDIPTTWEEMVFSLADMIVSRNEFRLEEEKDEKDRT